MYSGAMEPKSTQYVGHNWYTLGLFKSIQALTNDVFKSNTDTRILEYPGKAHAKCDTLLEYYSKDIRRIQVDFGKTSLIQTRYYSCWLVPSRLHTTSAACSMRTIGYEPAPAVFQPRRHRIFLNIRCVLLSAPLYWPELGPKYLAFCALFSISTTGKFVEHFKAWVNLVPNGLSSSRGVNTRDPGYRAGQGFPPVRCYLAGKQRGCDHRTSKS